MANSFDMPARGMVAELGQLCSSAKGMLPAGPPAIGPLNRLHAEPSRRKPLPPDRRSRPTVRQTPRPGSAPNTSIADRPGERGRVIVWAWLALSIVCMVTFPCVVVSVSRRGIFRVMSILHFQNIREAARCRFTPSSHRQPISQSVVHRPPVQHFGRQPQGHFQGVGTVVVIADGELAKLVDQEPRAGAARLEPQPA